MTKLQVLEPEVDRVKATVYRDVRPADDLACLQVGWVGTGGSFGSAHGISGAAGLNTDRDGRKALCSQGGQVPPYAQAREEPPTLRS